VGISRYSQPLQPFLTNSRPYGYFDFPWILETIASRTVNAGQGIAA
jgi:hypothetical protein